MNMYNIIRDEVLSNEAKIEALTAKNKAIFEFYDLINTDNPMNYTEIHSFVLSEVRKLLRHSVGIRVSVFNDIVDIKDIINSVNVVILNSCVNALQTQLFIDDTYNRVWQQSIHTEEEQLVYDTHYRYFINEYSTENNKTKSVYNSTLTGIMGKII